MIPAILAAILSNLPAELQAVSALEKLITGEPLTADDHAQLGAAMEAAHNAVQGSSAA